MAAERLVDSMRAWPERRSVRISIAALVRIKDDDRHVLVHSLSRPGSYGPPGGVYKYFTPAIGILEDLGFRPDRADSLVGDMRADLRGFLPVSSLRGFLRWFATGAYREDFVECLRRELAEELAEVDLGRLAPVTSELVFTHVRTVVEGPQPVPGRSFLQLRRYEVYDLVATGEIADRFRWQLIEAGQDDAVTGVICATTEQIRHGRIGPALIGGHSAYLIDTRRIHPDLPMVR